MFLPFYFSFECRAFNTANSVNTAFCLYTANLYLASIKAV